MGASVYNALNQLVTETFNEILKVEERSIKLATDDRLSLTEVHTLEAVGPGGSKSMTEVAAKLKIAVSTLTISINRLVNKGYVARFRTQEDRRVVKVQLTPEGESVVQAHSRFHERMIQAMVGRLNEGERKAFTQSVENLLAFFRDEDELVTQRLLERESSRPAVSSEDDIIGIENIQEISVD